MSTHTSVEYGTFTFTDSFHYFEALACILQQSISCDISVQEKKV